MKKRELTLILRKRGLEVIAHLNLDIAAELVNKEVDTRFGLQVLDCADPLFCLFPRVHNEDEITHLVFYILALGVLTGLHQKDHLLLLGGSSTLVSRHTGLIECTIHRVIKVVPPLPGRARAV